MRQSVQFAQSLAKHIPGLITGVRVLQDDVTVITSPSKICGLLRYLRDSPTTEFRGLMELTAVDYPTRKERFDVVYCLISYTYNTRVLVQCSLDEYTPLPTCTHLYPSANWAERELWDMFGIVVEDHPDLRRVLTDYGFDGHPLRKDFPLSGFVEASYDPSEKRVVLNQIELS
jgi:NADH/F420H2 dehydrogenase subunit C